MNDDFKNIVFPLLKKAAPGVRPEDLEPGDDIRRTLDIDSFDYLQFIIALSKDIGYDIPEQDYGRITTLKALFDYIESHLPIKK